MTNEQKEIILHLADVKIYYPGKAKRFIESLDRKLSDRPDSELSESQWIFICDLIHTYRKQLPTELHRRYCPNRACQLKMLEDEALARQLSLQFG